MYIYIHVCVYICVCVCVYIYIYIYTHTYICIYNNHCAPITRHFPIGHSISSSLQGWDCGYFVRPDFMCHTATKLKFKSSYSFLRAFKDQKVLMLICENFSISLVFFPCSFLFLKRINF